MSDEPTDDLVVDNVVHVRFKRSKEDLPTAPMKKSPRKMDRPFCVEHFFEYDLDARTITCSRCARAFDAFEALDHLANRWAHYDWNHRHIRGEIRDLTKERERVARQIANLKAQRRRLVPNVRQDIVRARSELFKAGVERNTRIAAALRDLAARRLDKILRTLDAFGDDTEKVSHPDGSKDGA